MPSPLISVLVATYNGDLFLRKQLDSIINQTYQDLEIIIQDDGSKDNTLKILQGYATDDSRIRLSQNKSNLGIVKNFYDLISKSNGEYIAISDQDDIWEIDKIEILINNISDSSLIYTDSTLIKDDDTPLGVTLLEQLGHAPKSGKFLMNLLTENTISGHACLFKADLKETILKSQHLDYHKSYMYDQLIGTIASFNNGVRYYEKPLTRHRIHSSNNHNTLEVEDKSDKSDKSDKKLLDKRQIARRKERRERKKAPFFHRKVNRTRIKIERARAKLVLLENIFSMYLVKKRSVFFLKSKPSVKFNTCFFNRKLYNELVASGFDKKEAQLLSIGKLYYAFFGIF